MGPEGSSEDGTYEWHNQELFYLFALRLWGPLWDPSRALFGPSRTPVGAPWGHLEGNRGIFGQTAYGRAAGEEGEATVRKSSGSTIRPSDQTAGCLADLPLDI